MQTARTGRGNTVMYRIGLCLMINLIGVVSVLYAADLSTNHIVLKGHVRDAKGKGIRGVSVTDGFNIVRTNEKGAYKLESTREAEFVYLTVPAGFQIPVVDNMPSFYKKIAHNGKVFTADFTLERMRRDDTRHYVVLWADPQINNADHAAQMHRTAVPDTRDHIRALQQHAPVYGIAAGDILWDAPGILPEYKKAVKEMGVPFFQVLGNHDMDIHVRTDERSDENFTRELGPSWYSFDRGNAHYIILDNVFYYSDGYNYIGYITERQFKWLEQDLAVVKPGAPVFVSMHIPAFTGERERLKLAKDNPGNITFNRRFLFDMLKPFNAHVLTGHTHYNENRVEAGVYEHIHAAVCGAWWTAPVCMDGTPRGYGVYEINGDSVSWYYKSIGFPKDHQMRVYNRGAYKARPSDVAVNVWNWDTAWKVVWYEDGVLQGEMKQEVYYDAEAQQVTQGPGSVHAWIKPVLTDHLFFATPTEKAAEVLIEVTDRFGNAYRELIKLP